MGVELCTRKEWPFIQSRVLMAKRVVVAMSGGVDSSVAAVLLLEAGYEVIGITLRIWEPDPPRGTTKDDLIGVNDARRVAEKLGIPFYVLDFREIFTREVVKYFADSYLQGRTPNPCIVCNNRVKFTALARQAESLKADYIATGHYARRGYDSATGRFTLHKGKDRKKDQSYVLFSLSQQQLAKSIFPLGEYTKEEVRALARAKKIPMADKPESQEICFIPENDYGLFLQKNRPEALQPGDIVDTGGRILGRHKGVAFYTIGQRKGLGIGGGTPYYVVALRPEEKQVVVGKDEEVFRRDCRVTGINWISIPPPRSWLTADVKIRYTAQAAPAVIEPEEDGARIRFSRLQRAVTPGQAAVFYRQDLVLGGGFIT